MRFKILLFFVCECNCNLALIDLWLVVVLPWSSAFLNRKRLPAPPKGSNSNDALMQQQKLDVDLFRDFVIGNAAFYTSLTVG